MMHNFQTVSVVLAVFLANASVPTRATAAEQRQAQGGPHKLSLPPNLIAAMRAHPEKYLRSDCIGNGPDRGAVAIPLGLPGDRMNLIDPDRKAALMEDRRRFLERVRQSNGVIDVPDDCLFPIDQHLKVVLAEDERRTLEKLRHSKVPNAHAAYSDYPDSPPAAGSGPPPVEVLMTSDSPLFLTYEFSQMSPIVLELLRCGRSIPGYASPGDLLWTVRFTKGFGTAQEAWVSSTTGKVRFARPYVLNERADWGWFPAPVRRAKRKPTESVFGTRDEGPLPAIDPNDFRGFVVPKPVYLAGDHLAISQGGAPVHGQSPDVASERGDFLRALRASKVPSPKQAVALAQAVMAKSLGADRGAKAVVIGLLLVEDNGEWQHQATFDDGDPTWLVRFTNNSGEVVQQAWVNAITGKIDWMFPLDAAPESPAPKGEGPRSEKPKQ